MADWSPSIQEYVVAQAFFVLTINSAIYEHSKCKKLFKLRLLLFVFDITLVFSKAEVEWGEEFDFACLANVSPMKGDTQIIKINMYIVVPDVAEILVTCGADLRCLFYQGLNATVNNSSSLTCGINGSAGDIGFNYSISRVYPFKFQKITEIRFNKIKLCVNKRTTFRCTSIAHPPATVERITCSHVNSTTVISGGAELFYTTKNDTITFIRFGVYTCTCSLKNEVYEDKRLSSRETSRKLKVFAPNCCRTSERKASKHGKLGRTSERKASKYRKSERISRPICLQNLLRSDVEHRENSVL
ncbi:hypothetical protein HELRODRAFT_161945 [Helobdella robusta]|uniref:Uncharacterized protein n=1 Tax=Helobdella robusta TaxID=6412 RepID=T1ES22_HELRO|nr:hypothetical protein HELRODRAFT_161945 [Helobdella robusta]ESO02655.1 hypothetical protein HELRODRAFT_161945 [Helobdella robusta]